ncbi:MAG TPA: hypothetical protein VEK11_14255 [Thermoanaerobaculia bacterium]|nr:hypothetical protein [Thermoanaerobaculia bacterium]
MIRGVTILAIVLFASPVAAASEAGAVFQSMASVLDMAYEIERYALRHGRLPAAQSPAELSQALLGTDSMTEVLVDAWGTPLHIDSNPDTKRYVVASAGADKRFDRAQWTARAATNDAAADIVIRDGEMLRWPEEWALARFRAEDGDATRALSDALETSKAVRTLADMALLRMKLEEHVTAHGTLPAALAPELPQRDGWGHAFAVTIDRAAKTYRIVSAGADGKFDEKRWSEEGETLDLTRDAVLQNGELGPSWQTHGGTRERDAAYAHFSLFKMKHAALRTISDDERRKLRLEGLGDDMDDAAERQDWSAAMNLYEENEKLGVRDTERLRSWALSFTQNADARQRAAAGRIGAALRRALAEAEDAERWALTETLADLERARGETATADQLLETWAAAHPNDPMPRVRQLVAAQRGGDTARVLHLAGELLTAEPAGKDALYATGVAFYEVVAQSGDAIPADRRRTFAAHARRMLERAAALDENAMEPLVYLSLVVRQQATFESDSTKAAKLVEEADAIRGRAIEISKRRRGGQ